MDPVYDPVRERTPKHLLEALAEVLRHQGVHDGVQAGVGVRHQVRENANDVGCVVEREVAEQHAQDNQVMRQPTQTEEHGHNDYHLGHLALGLAGFRHVLHGVHRGPKVADGAGVRDAENEDWDEVAEYEGADVHGSTMMDVPRRDAKGGPV